MFRSRRIAIFVPAVLVLMNGILALIAAAGDAGPCLPLGC
jgi:hypothetical protein